MLSGSFAAASGHCSDCGKSDQLLWGDLHVHTSYSLDANVFGTLATPADAYRFAKGAPLTRADGTKESGLGGQLRCELRAEQHLRPRDFNEDEHQTRMK